MNCHETEPAHAGRKEHGAGREKGHFKHLLMMVACCGLPILLVGLLPLFRSTSGGAGDLIGRYAFLLCPIMMVPMMLSIRVGKKANGVAAGREDRATPRAKPAHESRRDT